MTNFNPLTPCGVRRHPQASKPGFLSFQSTHPMRGETAVPKWLGEMELISIHSPHAG